MREAVKYGREEVEKNIPVYRHSKDRPILRRL